MADIILAGNISGSVTIAAPAIAGTTVITLPATTGTLLASGGALGTPSSGTLTNCTGLPVAGGGTGVTTSTGSGANVLGTSPTLVTPALGTPSSGTLTNCTFPTLNQNTTGSSASCTGNAATSTTATNQSGGTVSATTGAFSGTMTLPVAAGASYIKAGTGDGASFTTYNVKINSWWGIGFGDYQDLTTVKVYIDCRSGNIGTSGAFVGNVTGNVTGSSASCTGNSATATSLSTIVGSAPSYACRAWVNFNSTGTVSIYGSGNCSSITDNGVGNFTFNFTTAMPDVNYSVTTGPTQSSSNNNGGLILVFLSAAATYSAPLVGSFRFINVHAANTALGDSTYNCLSVFR